MLMFFHLHFAASVIHEKTTALGIYCLRFAVIHVDNPRPDISFYPMRTAHNTNRVSKLTTIKGKQANAHYWSPAGCFIVLAGLNGFNGQLEFYNVDELETMAAAEQFMATDFEWDPTGRYVATSVTSVHEMENGFNIWSFSGKLLYRILKDHFFQERLLWLDDFTCGLFLFFYLICNLNSL